MWQFLRIFFSRFQCVISGRHAKIREPAIFGRVLPDGRREGLHICPYCEANLWLPDADPEIFIGMY